MLMQVVGKKLKDTRGGYAQFLRENKGEAKVMEEKEKRVKVLEQSTVKAKSKVCALLSIGCGLAVWCQQVYVNPLWTEGMVSTDVCRWECGQG